MSGQFVARRGLIALGDTTITGSLNISQNIITAGTIQGTFDGSTSTAISGAFDSVSASLASDISLNAASINSLNAASSSYLLNTTDTLDGDLTVTGKITAQEFHTEFVSASIIFQSGSTKFGDSADDIHSFTGSLNLSGSLTYGGTGLTILGQSTDGADNQAFFIGAGGSSSDTRGAYIWGRGNEAAEGGKIQINAGNVSTGNIELHTGGSVRMFVSSSGNVGIGTTSPNFKLDVNGIGRFGSSNSKVVLGSHTDTYTDEFTTITSNNHGDFVFGVNLTITSDRTLITTNSHARLQGSAIHLGGNNNPLGSNTIAFFAQPDSAATAGTVLSSTSARMVITNAGNVGIGTTSPATKLDVVGQVRASTGILFGADTAAANALDDYEEGTWSTGLYFEGGSATYANSTCSYTKIGNVVFVAGRIALSSVSNPSGNLRLSLPFAPAGGASKYSNISIITLFYNAPDNLLTQVFTVENDINPWILQSVDNAAWSVGQASVLTGNEEFQISGFYFVA